MAIRSDVNWRLAVYAGAVVGGLMWAVLIGVDGVSGNERATTATELASFDWRIAAMASAATVIAGGAASIVARSVVVRSLGVALMVGAVSGWVLAGAGALWAALRVM